MSALLGLVRFGLAGALVLTLLAGALLGMLVFPIRPDLLAAYGGLLVLLIALLVLTYPVQRRTRIAAGAIAAFSTAAALIGPTAYWHARFHVERPCLEALATSDRPQACGARGAVALRDSDITEAYAVPWTGVADNWIGPCRDPTGIVRHARSWPARTQIPALAQEATERFGGDITKASRLSGDWYLCWAT